MKKQLLKLGTFFLAVVFVVPAMADLPVSPRLSGTFKTCAVAPTIDGTVAAGEVWSLIPVVPMARVMVGEVPTFTTCYYKAVWNDTALFVLQYVDEDVFMPCWNADPVSAEHWLYDKFEWYIDVNDTLTDAAGPITPNSGHYQFAPTYQEEAVVGTIADATPSSSGVGFYSDTWDADEAIVTREGYMLWESIYDHNADLFEAVNGATIGFESQFIDVDVTITAGDGTVRQRATWSNTASDDDDSWVSMDSCGVVTLSTEVISSVYSPSVENSMFVTPTLAEDFIQVSADVLSASIYNTAGILIAMFDTRNNQVIDVTSFPAGIYFVTMKNDLGVVTQKIVIE